MVQVPWLQGYFWWYTVCITSITALLRRSARWLAIAMRPYQLNALQRILAVYTRWCNTGYPGAPETFKLLGWPAPQPPTACLATFGDGHVYVIVNIKHRLGVYIGWTVKDISARFYEHAYSKSTRKHREVLLRKRMTQFGIHNFIIIGLELVVSETNIGQHKLPQLREQFWQSKLQGLRRAVKS
jgi:hypothetical protein